MSNPLYNLFEVKDTGYDPVLIGTYEDQDLAMMYAIEFMVDHWDKQVMPSRENLGRRIVYQDKSSDAKLVVTPSKTITEPPRGVMVAHSETVACFLCVGCRPVNKDDADRRCLVMHYEYTQRPTPAMTRDECIAYAQNLGARPVFYHREGK